MPCFQGGCRGSFIANALIPSSRLLLWARSILSLKKTSTCPTLSGWQRMIVLRKPKKVGHTDWHLAEGAGRGTAQIHISGRLPSSSLCRPPRCTTLSGHVMCLLMKVWEAGKEHGLWSQTHLVHHAPAFGPYTGPISPLSKAPCTQMYLPI